MDEYIRIGSDRYYKKTKKGLINWSRQGLVDDHGKDVLKTVTRFDDFCNEPSHIDYKREIDGEYNLYRELSHVPKEGKCDTILGFMEHVFGEQLEIGLDYIQLLYMKPKQILPILCLVSDERGTGKTTFGYFLTWIFQDNSGKINQKQLSTEFNGSYADKLVCFIDESLVKSASILENLKDLSTSKTIPLRKMRSEHVEIPFFCKFLLMSNHVDTFVNVDQEEVRYWIRVLHKANSFDGLFDDKLKSEIPAFLYMLKNRELSVPVKKSRMWFESDSLNTEALQRLKNASISDDEKTFLSWANDICMNESVDTEFRFTIASVKDNCFSKRLSEAKCRILVNKLFPLYGSTKKARSNNSSYTGSKMAYIIPMLELERLCVSQRYCKNGDLAGVAIEATEEEVKRLEDLNLFNGDEI